MKRVIFAPLIAIPLVAVLAFGFQRDPNAPAMPLLGKVAPVFTLRSLEGRQVSLADFRGHPILINFWASWCTSCTAEHRYLVSSWRAFEPRGVVFLGVAYDDSAAAARKFLRAHGGGWVSVQDPSGATAVEYGVSGVPETVLVDRRGVVRFRSPGPVVPGGAMSPAALSRDLSTLLREPA